LYFHSNAFAFNPQTHLCFYTYLIKFEEGGVSNCNVFDAPFFSLCEVWKYFKQPCFESFPHFFDFSHIKLWQYP